MRSALLATLSLALLSFGCAQEALNYDEYPGSNIGIDLRNGEYTPGQGAPEPMNMSLPPHIIRPQGMPDGPVIETPMVVNPVHPGVTPVADSRLAGLLPAPPKGWAAEEANGRTLATPSGIMTEGQRSYWSGKTVASGATPDGGEGGLSIDVTIVDRGQTGPSVVEAVSAADAERRGYAPKAVTVEGFPGREFMGGPGLRQVDVDVTDRFLVRVRGANVSSEELHAWVAKLPLKDLAALR